MHQSSILVKSGEAAAGGVITRPAELEIRSRVREHADERGRCNVTNTCTSHIRQCYNPRQLATHGASYSRR